MLKQAGCSNLSDRLSNTTPGVLFLELLADAEIAELDKVTSFAAEHVDADPVWYWITRLASLYPRDPGLLAPIFLHYVRLEPGEAIYVPAGLIHAYLHGFAVEVMGASDNVLRAGLTPKHVDVPELSRVVSTESAPVSVITGTRGADGWNHWHASSPYFHLMGADVATETMTVEGPAIVIAVQGSIVVSSTEQRHQVDAGRGAFIAAADRATISGSGRIYACTTPRP